MIEQLAIKTRAGLMTQAPKLWRRLQSFPLGLVIAIVVIAFVGGRYYWICAQRPAHRQEIAAAYGSVRLFYGQPQSDRAGNRVTFVGTSDKGYGVFLADVATGHKIDLREEAGLGATGDYHDLQVWPWAPDDSVFIYSTAGQINLCNPETGKVMAELKTPTYVNSLVWLTPGLFACVEADGNLYQFEKQEGGSWQRKESSQSSAGYTLRSVNEIKVANATDKTGVNDASGQTSSASWTFGHDNTSMWSQCQFSDLPGGRPYGGHPQGSAWAITQYKLIGGANDANPRDWQLSGSADGTNWTLLDARTNETFTALIQTNQYIFPNQTPYWFYRLKITATADDADTNTQPIGFQLWSEDTAGVASASAENAPTYSAAAAFDGLTDTKWWNDNQGSSGWLQYEFGGAAGWAVSQYEITSGDNGPRRDPMDWQLQASNDGDTWTDLDSRTGEIFSDRLQTKSYSFTNTIPCRFYRLNITANQGGGGEGVQLSELNLKSTLTDSSGDVKTVSVSQSPFSGVFSLTALTNDTIAYGQGNRLWSLNLTSNNSLP